VQVIAGAKNSTGSHAGDGLFAASCLLHTAFALDAPKISGESAVTALFKWTTAHMASAGSASGVNGAEHIWLDTCAGDAYWPPCNAKCPPPDTVSV
jgi:hypothetical protein